MDIKFGFESINQKGQKDFDRIYMNFWIEKDKHETNKM